MCHSQNTLEFYMCDDSQNFVSYGHWNNDLWAPKSVLK